MLWFFSFVVVLLENHPIFIERCDFVRGLCGGRSGCQLLCVQLTFLIRWMSSMQCASEEKKFCRPKIRLMHGKDLIEGKDSQYIR